MYLKAQYYLKVETGFKAGLDSLLPLLTVLFSGDYYNFPAVAMAVQPEP